MCNADLRKAIGDLQQKLSELTAEVGSLKEKANEVPVLKSAIARQGNELTDTRRRNEELGGRIRPLEEENRLLRKSNEGLKGQLTRVEAGQQILLARLQNAITAGGSKVNEDLGNVQRDVAKSKEEVMLNMRMTGGQYFAPSMKKGEIQVGRNKVEFHVPDGIIEHLTRECRGNVHDHCVIDVISGTFEKETYGAHSGAFRRGPNYPAKNVANLKTVSLFRSAYRRN